VGSRFPRDFAGVLWKILRHNMKTLITSCLVGASFGLLTICSNTSRAADSTNQPPAASATPAAATAPAPVNEVAVIKTTDGDMVVQFWSDVAPKTVENFKKLAKSGFYNGQSFHRIVKGFMIQGGDPNTKDPAASPDTFGQGGPGYTIPDEFHDRPHARGVISMAHTGAPNSGGSQFFICLDTDAVQPLNGKYAAFGKLIKGDDVLEKIGNSPCTGPNAMGEMSIPNPRVGIISITSVPADSIK
jgi:peptidyl-prolyl cis-trans isomerase B (cyclophilin B)